MRLAPRRGREGGEKAVEICQRQGIDAGSSSTFAAAETAAKLMRPGRGKQRRAHADHARTLALLQHDMSAPRLGIRQLVGEAAEDAPAPWCVGQEMGAGRRILPMRGPRHRSVEIGPLQHLDLFEDAFAAEHL